MCAVSTATLESTCIVSLLQHAFTKYRLDKLTLQLPLFMLGQNSMLVVV